MKPPFRIAILECDIPLDETRDKAGGHFGVYKALLESAADALGYPGLSSKEGLDLKRYRVQAELEYPSLDEIDAILISGSRYNSFDNDPWIIKLVDFVKEVLNQNRVRVIGICYGHQIVGRALGAKVGRSDGGWELSVLPFTVSPRGKELFKKDVVSLHQLHRDAVFDCPPGVETLGSSPKCSIQGLYSKGRLITVQGHPEFTNHIMRGLVESRHDQGIFDDELYKGAIVRVEESHDGVAVAEAFLRFLLED